jgi:hypothetical protein
LDFYCGARPDTPLKKTPTPGCLMGAEEITLHVSTQVTIFWVIGTIHLYLATFKPISQVFLFHFKFPLSQQFNVNAEDW